MPFISVALNYVPSAAEARWRNEGDQLECRLAQPIPVFGNAVFTRRAGEMGRFHLDSYETPASDEPVRLVVQAPMWKPQKHNIILGEVETSATTRPVQIGYPLSDRLLAHLQEGMFPVFSNWNWFSGEDPVSVGMSAVNFMPAYRDYQRCLSGLLQLDFEELKTSKVLFDTGEHNLTPASRQRLRTVAQLIRADSSIKQCHVAGYTDDVGTSRSNMDLSRRRAEAVEHYLVELGIEPSILKTTFHGEANWVSSMKNEEGRALNRRVTVRLERGK